MIGTLFLIIAFAAAIYALYCFGTAATGRGRMDGQGKLAYTVMAGTLLAAALLLLYLLFSHQFRYEYVYSYTDLRLPPFYLLSAFWAGQEGTFLLWSLYGGSIGLLLLRSKKESNGAMSFVTLTQVLLLGLLLVKSPFRTLPASPADGLGLNPLLQNPWMVIHPPVVFLGYAAMVVPFASALSALLRREYEQWVREAMPWTLLAWLALSAGIFIGGYWAYMVLGWGGYWSWDPVENSSLIPWLTGTALLHGLIVQRYRGSMRQTNLFFAIATYLLVFYATFLTRSGVLADFSVHSFADLGAGRYLLAALLLIALTALGLYLTRRGDFKAEEREESFRSKDFSFFLTILLLGIAAAIVGLGTSAPVITRLTGTPTSVGGSFYNTTQAPIGILLAVLLGLCPYLAWQGGGGKSFRNHGISLAAAAAGTVLAVLAGVRTLWIIAFIAALTFALTANLTGLLRAARTGPLHIGGYLSHVGVSLMLAGIIVSSNYSETVYLALPLGRAGTAFGYSLEYTGMVQVEVRKETMRLAVSGENGSFTAEPLIYTDPASGSLMREPFIHRTFLSDLYISPLEVRQTSPEAEATVVLAQGESRSIGGYVITFEKFAMNTHDGSAAVQVGAQLRVTPDGGTTITATPRLSLKPDGWAYEPVMLAGGTTLVLESLNADAREIRLLLLPAGVAAPESAGTETALVEVSRKPLVSLLWAGAALLLAGTAVALRRRWLERSVKDSGM